MSRPTQIESMRLKEKWHAIIATAGAASRRITGRSGPTVSEPGGRATVVTLGKLPERGPGGQRATAGDQLLTVIVTPAEVVVWPAASRAMAVSVYVPFGTPCESHASVNFVIGESVVTSDPMFCPLTWNWTPAMARSSTAVAVRLTVPVSVAPSDGRSEERRVGKGWKCRACMSN